MESFKTFPKRGVDENPKARVTPRSRATVTGRSRLVSMMWTTYEKASFETHVEEVDAGSIKERMIDANSEHPTTRETKTMTDDSMTLPATSLFSINEHDELNMIKKTMTGATNMNAAMKLSATIGKRSILIGMMDAIKSPARKDISNEYSKRILIIATELLNSQPLWQVSLHIS